MADLHRAVIQVGTVGEYGPAFAPAYQFVGLKAAEGNVPEAADRLPTPGRPVGVRDILDQRQAMAVAQLPEDVELRRIAERMDHHNGPGRLIDQSLYRCGIRAAGVRLNVRQRHPRTALHRRQNRHPVGDGRHNDGITRGYPKRLHGGKAGGGSVIAAQGKADAKERSQRGLEVLKRLKVE